MHAEKIAEVVFKYTIKNNYHMNSHVKTLFLE